MTFFFLLKRIFTVKKSKAKIYSSKPLEAELSLRRTLLILDVSDSFIDFVLLNEFVQLEPREVWLHGELIIHIKV